MNELVVNWSENCTIVIIILSGEGSLLALPKHLWVVQCNRIFRVPEVSLKSFQISHPAPSELLRFLEQDVCGRKQSHMFAQQNSIVGFQCDISVCNFALINICSISLVYLTCSYTMFINGGQA